jgi:hypothetical protein
MNEILLTNIGTIIVALLAGMIALYQVKSNIISDARVKWIESLRETLSQYCKELEECSASKHILLYEIQGKTGKDFDVALKEFYPHYSATAKEVLKLQSKVFLYLNSNNKEHKELEELLRKTSIILHIKNEDHSKQIQENIGRIIAISKNILKEEWEKSKKIFKI